MFDCRRAGKTRSTGNAKSREQISLSSSRATWRASDCATSCEASRSSAPTFPRSKSYSLSSFHLPHLFRALPRTRLRLFFPSPFLAEYYLSFSRHVFRPAGFDRNFSRVNAREKKKRRLKKRIGIPYAATLFFSSLISMKEIAKCFKETSRMK